MKWISALIVAVFLASSAAVAADIPDEQVTPSNPPTSDRYTGIYFAVGEDDKNTMSALEAFTADGTSRQSKMLTRTVCKKIGRKRVSNPGHKCSVYAYFSPKCLERSNFP
jgi:hypothetical protein